MQPLGEREAPPVDPKFRMLPGEEQSEWVELLDRVNREHLHCEDRQTWHNVHRYITGVIGSLQSSEPPAKKYLPRPPVPPAPSNSIFYVSEDESSFESANFEAPSVDGASETSDKRSADSTDAAVQVDANTALADAAVQVDANTALADVALKADANKDTDSDSETASNPDLPDPVAGRGLLPKMQIPLDALIGKRDAGHMFALNHKRGQELLKVVRDELESVFHDPEFTDQVMEAFLTHLYVPLKKHAELVREMVRWVFHNATYLPLGEHLMEGYLRDMRGESTFAQHIIRELNYLPEALSEAVCGHVRAFLTDVGRINSSALAQCKPSKEEAPTAIVLSVKVGAGGHTAPHRAMEARLKECGYRVATVHYDTDLPEDEDLFRMLGITFEDGTPMTKYLFGARWVQQSRNVSQAFVVRHYINYFSSVYSQLIRDRSGHDLLFKKVLPLNPSIVVTTLAYHWSWTALAWRLPPRVKTLLVASDAFFHNRALVPWHRQLDLPAFGRKLHFPVMTDDLELLRSFVKHHDDYYTKQNPGESFDAWHGRANTFNLDDQITVIGAPINPSFNVDVSESGIAMLRHKWGLPADAVSVCISRGKLGWSNDLTEALEGWRTSAVFVKPVYIQVVCGENELFYENLLNGGYADLGPNITVVPHPLRQPADFAELRAISIIDDIKPGGGSTFEGWYLISRGVQSKLLLTPTEELWWERSNCDAMRKWNVGVTIEKGMSKVEVLQDLLASGLKPITHKFPDWRPAFDRIVKELTVGDISEVIERANRDHLHCKDAALWMRVRQFLIAKMQKESAGLYRGYVHRKGLVPAVRAKKEDPEFEKCRTRLEETFLDPDYTDRLMEAVKKRIVNPFRSYREISRFLLRWIAANAMFLPEGEALMEAFKRDVRQQSLFYRAILENENVSIPVGAAEGYVADAMKLFLKDAAGINRELLGAPKKRAAGAPRIVILSVEHGEGGHVASHRAIEARLKERGFKVDTIRYDTDLGDELDPYRKLEMTFADGSAMTEKLVQTRWVKQGENEVMANIVELYAAFMKAEQPQRFRDSRGHELLHNKVRALQPDLVLTNMAYHWGWSSLAYRLGAEAKTCLVSSDVFFHYRLMRPWSRQKDFADEQRAIAFTAVTDDEDLLRAKGEVHDQYWRNKFPGAPLEESWKPVFDHLTLDSQIHVIGAPVNPAFDVDVSPQGLARLRKKWGLADDAVAVTLARGKIGSSEDLKPALNGWRSDFEFLKEVQLHVVCGENDALYEELKGGAYSDLAPNLMIVPHRLLTPQDYAELRAISTVVDAKPGGSSTFESWSLISRGLSTKLLMTVSPSYWWERVNAVAMEMWGVGTIVEGNVSKPAALQALMVENPKPPHKLFREWKEPLDRLVDRLIRRRSS